MAGEGPEDRRPGRDRETRVRPFGNSRELESPCISLLRGSSKASEPSQDSRLRDSPGDSYCREPANSRRPSNTASGLHATIDWETKSPFHSIGCETPA